MLARNPLRALLVLALFLSPIGLAACDSKPATSTPTDGSGVNPDILKNYPTKENKAAK